jgi:signal transduction histidine kinase
LGYTEEELLSEPFLTFVHPDDHEETQSELEKLAAGEHTINFVNRYMHKDGTVHYLEWTATPVQESNLVYCIARDITKRKKVEEQLHAYQQRLRALASELTLAEEKERRSIAVELHDGIGQTLAFARMRLATLRQVVSAPKPIAVLEETSEAILEAIRDTRNVVFELSAPSMNEIGLAAAIGDWLKERIQGVYGLETELLDHCGRIPLEENKRAILFRNVRELLLNVVKHAQAGKVTVSLESESGQMRVVIQDDGIGLDPEALGEGEAKGSGFGLFSIKERMSDLGGSLDIQSSPGGGCRAILTVPLGCGRGQAG